MALVVMAVLALAHPALAQSRREMQMMADIRMLQEQAQQLQIALAQLNEALKAINTRLDDQTNVNRKAFADQKLNTDQLSSDLRVVRERVDETNVRIGSLSQEVEGLRVSIPQYSMQPPTDPNLSPDATGETPAPPPGAPLPPGMSPQRMYDMAWTDYTAGQWAICVTGFDNYLRTFPRSELADEAQFYVGECNYSDGKFTEAIDAYNKVISNYPKGESVPNAYYKRGIAFERLGDADRARESFEAVVNTYPDSDAARLAKQALARVSRQPAGH